MKKQRQIYFFLPNFSTGGAGNSIFNICKSINRANRSLNVISIGKNPIHLTQFTKNKHKLKIKGHSVMMGYLDQELNKKSFKSKALFISI